MSLSEEEIAGTLKPDGTLELDAKPALPPGRVTVILRPVPAAEPPQESLWEFMQRGRAELEAAGHHFMDEAEMNAWIEELRADDDRIERAYRECVKEPEK
jgi:hypothetical protein